MCSKLRFELLCPICIRLHLHKLVLERRELLSQLFVARSQVFNLLLRVCNSALLSLREPLNLGLLADKLPLCSGRLFLALSTQLVCFLLLGCQLSLKLGDACQRLAACSGRGRVCKVDFSKRNRVREVIVTFSQRKNLLVCILPLWKAGFKLLEHGPHFRDIKLPA